MTQTLNISVPFLPSRHEMHGHAPDGSDTAWAFNLEAAAVLLIVGGQLLGALSAAGALPPGEVQQWLNDCLFPLQIPVLFFCLGYLYQRFNAVRSRPAWAAFMKREALVLLVPFAVFTLVILVANTLAGRAPAFTLASLVGALLIQPLEPLGYLYTAFLLLAITPTVKSRRNAYGLLLAAALVKVAIVGLLTAPATAAPTASLPFALTSMAENWIWLAGGMAVALLRALPLLRSSEKAWALGALWIAASVITFMVGGIGELSHAVLDAIGILWGVSLFATVFRQGHQDGFFGFITRFTMALFLMGGPFITLAWGLLGLMGLTGAGAAVVYVATGLVAAFVLPVLTQKALERLGKADFVVYPARFLPRR